MSINKIGCVIAYRKGHTNYGTSLVGYALIKKIQVLGYDVEVINYVKQLTFSEKLAWMVNALRCNMGKLVLDRFNSTKDLKNNAEYAAHIKVRTEAVEAYKERKLIPFFHTYRGYKALHDGSKDYDAIVVGSDQVWTPLSLPTKFFNLLFVDDSVPRRQRSRFSQCRQQFCCQRRKCCRYHSRHFLLRRYMCDSSSQGRSCISCFTEIRDSSYQRRRRRSSASDPDSHGSAHHLQFERAF